MVAPSAMLPGVEAMQMQAAPPRQRAQRQTSSCLECRRRKQKCSQGQPCTNCFRRFPTPECIYEVKSSRRVSPLTQRPQLPTIADIRDGPYSHLNPAAIQGALYSIEDQLPSPASSLSSLSSPTASSSTSLSTQSTRSLWRPYRTAASSDGDTDETIADTIKKIKEESIKSFKRSYLDEGTTRIESYVPMALGYSIGGSMTQLNYLPMRPTKINKDLVRIHLSLLSRFKCSIDGQPDPANVFMNIWIPCTMQDPLLLHIVLFTSACFLTETGAMSKRLRQIYQSHVYFMLNQQLGDQIARENDTLMLAVVQMITDSWYWGETDHLMAHLRGLKHMVRMRGGLSRLGLRGYLAKMILVHDIAMALAHEITPAMYGHPKFPFHDPKRTPIKTAYNTPLLCHWQSFRECSNSLQLHPSTAEILDIMRSLFSAVISLPRDPSSDQIQTVRHTATVFYGKIDEFPESTPPLRGSCNSSRSSSVESPDQSPRSSRTDKSSSPYNLPERMYLVVRRIALIYCKAISNRSPISTACSEEDITVIWPNIWQLGLPTWKSILGIFVWVMIALSTNCHKTRFGRLIKTLTVSTMMSLGMDDWHLFLDIAKTAFRIQRWLAEGGNDSSTGQLVGGQAVVDQYDGFAMDNACPEFDLSVDDEQ
ncbi:6-hydroxy-d-nicotine oxidase [Fusarium langsethiae]|uniref:6-hydroxy-d-nicotine oxidase n=1 Tax=Fusarium langsethiae TaxID=179993 RepID=A0A0N0DGL7_FUSLA|nr:6-hydroxy-d-nicotine oxidase [Fusarium langsethiae]